MILFTNYHSPYALIRFGDVGYKLAWIQAYHGKETVANANLITEAFNVTHKTGYTPKQLAEQKTELLECLDRVLGSFSLERTENFELLNKCKQAIKKATE